MELLTFENLLSVTTVSFLLSVIFTYLLGANLTDEDLQNLQNGVSPKSTKVFLLALACMGTGLLFRGGILVTLALLVKKLLD